MIDSTLTLYKLIVLYALDRAPFPLTNAQLSDLFLSRNYTTYFRLQEVLSGLTGAGLIEASAGDHTTSYTLTPQGRETVVFFSGDISPEIRQETADYLREHLGELRREAEVTADHTRISGQEHLVRCRASEDEHLLIELQLNVPTEAAAARLAENWKTKAPEVYEAVIRILS